MKKLVLLALSILFCSRFLLSETVYVDSISGQDENPGTQNAPVLSISKAVELVGLADNDVYRIKINPGIYLLDHHVKVQTDKITGADKRLVIEASILPDDSQWIPENMPVILSTALKGEIPELSEFVVGFLIDESHVTLRGLKFTGYSYPNSLYFPIARGSKDKTDLLVQQCLFVAEKEASHIQVAVIAHGNEVVIDHCIFYQVDNGVVFYMEAEGFEKKTGNKMTHCIVYGANESAIWSSWPEGDFVFKNNVVADGKYFWIKNYFNPMEYSMSNCHISGNKYYQGIAKEIGTMPEVFPLKEQNVTHEGPVMLRKIESVREPLPRDYLHVIPETPGSEIGAGLFGVKMME